MRKLLLLTLLGLCNASCDEDKYYTDLEISDSAIDLYINDETTIEVRGGRGEYSLINSDQKVSTASITNGVILIKGKAAGENRITIKDEHGDKKVLTVTVHYGKLELPWVGVGLLEKTVYDINFKNDNYSVISSDESIATVVLTENLLSVSGKAPGTTELIFTNGDKSKMGKVEVTVYYELILSTQTLSLKKGEIKTITIERGNAPYSIVPNSGIGNAKYSLTGNIITIEGVKAGELNILVQDSRSKKGVIVTITE